MLTAKKFSMARIVVIKSTEGGDVSNFIKQDYLFTQSLKGIHQNKAQQFFFINAAISKVLVAKNEWQKILQCAAQPEIEIIISNTTEVGIVLDETDNIHLNPPKSFPGKLLSFLYERYKIFEGNTENGFIIIATELIIDNAIKLKNILIELAKINQLENNFIEWLITANDFCNSLVDRIVSAANNKTEDFFYDDELAIESELYGLWAIETASAKTKNKLSFSLANDGIVITGNIKKFRELKLRLLNAPHSFSCALALLYGFKFVNATMQNVVFKSFLKQLMYNEIIPCIIDEDISTKEAEAFAETVLNRFLNPYIHHQWYSITTQFTGKIKERCVPLVCRHYQISNHPPQKMALGFAAYLLFMKTEFEDEKYYRKINENNYLLQDVKAQKLYASWQLKDVDEVVKAALSDKELWLHDLNNLPGFNTAVISYIKKIEQGISLSELINE